MSTDLLPSETKPMASSVSEGKYLTFNLADETYGVGVLEVREIKRGTQSNAANAEETASSCTQLESLSQSLKQTVEQLTMLLKGQRTQTTTAEVPSTKKTHAVSHSISSTPKQPSLQKNGYSAASLTQHAPHKPHGNDQPVLTARTSSKLMKNEK